MALEVIPDMKTKIVLFISVLMALSPCFGLEIDERDKQYHMEASYALQASSSLILKNKFKLSSWEAGLYGALGTLALGTAKEYAFDDKADPQDLQADAVGVGFAFPIVFFNF
jgi:hypothetical protein